MIEVCVVIPTFGRPQLLARCLRALARQTLPRGRFEVIIVSDGPPGRSVAVVDEAVSDGGLTCRLVSLPERRGPAAARNAGWRASAAPTIAFTDDDCVPHRDWLVRGLAALAHADAVWGRVKVPLPARPSDYERNESGLDGAEFVTANCFVTRAALRVVGGFDERFTSAWREDSDLYFSLLESNLVVRPAPDARVIHPVRPASWGVSIFQQRKVRFDALLYKKHPKYFREKIGATPPWRYYRTAALAGATAGLTAAGFEDAACVSAVLWAAETLALAARRIRNNRRDPSHVLEMIATSIFLPFLSIFWRLTGALRFGAPFL